MSHQLDLNLLKIFLILWDERSVSRAALKCNVTQSAMSHSLKRLRAMLNDDLFQRSGHQLAPTRMAMELEPRLRKALRQVESAIAPVEFDAKASQRRFVLAAGPYNCEILLPGVIVALKAEAPMVTLQLVPLGPELGMQIASGAVDLAIGSFDSWDTDVEGISLFREDMIWIARRGHPISGIAHKELLRAAGRVEVSTEGISTYYESRKGVKPRTTVRPFDAAITDGPPSSPFRPADVVVYDNRTAIEIVSVTDLVAMVPRRVVERYAGVFPVQIIDTGHVPASNSISMIWSRHYSMVGEHCWFRDIIARCAGSVCALRETEPTPL